MQSYTVTSNRNVQTRNLLAFKGEAQTINYDFSPWETDNGAVTSVTWTTQHGNAAATNKTLSSSIAQAVITTSEAGKSMVTLEIAAGNNTMKQYLHILTKDPHILINDYSHYGYHGR